MKNKSHIDALLLVDKDPWEEPRGGQTTFAKHLLKTYKKRLAVASTCKNALPVGQWINREFEGEQIKYYNIGSLRLIGNRKPLIPAHIQMYHLTQKHIKSIHAYGVRNILLDSSAWLFSAARYDWDSVCYCFGGVNNPAANSRYLWIRLLGTLYERKMVRTLHSIEPEVIIASADEQAIDEFMDRTGNVLDRNKLYSFPTRVDTDKFYPQFQDFVRADLGLAADDTILVAVGRVSEIKGWDLLLQTVAYLKKTIPKIRIVFVGDGEDHFKLKNRARALAIPERVRITGFLPQEEVRKYINAADVCVVGSHKEGWSLAMLEILACGKPLVSTAISGSNAMLRQGKNGFVVNSRDHIVYAEAVRKTLKLDNAKETSLEIAMKYCVRDLQKQLGVLWPPLS